MNEQDMKKIKHAITMPEGLADDLLCACDGNSGRKSRCSRRPGFYATAAAILCLCIGSTSFAYNTYQEKQLAIFMEPDLIQGEIEALGSAIAKISDISSYQYVSGDEAWAEFKAAYFSGDPESEALADAFTENPLANSFNYRVSVRMGADTQAVREQIGRLPGVRKITTVREAKAESRAE